MSYHSPFSPSAMSRWGTCSGSIRACEGLPNISSKYADEGTMAHDIASVMLTEEVKGGVRVWPEGVDEEMKAAVEVYLDYVLTEYRALKNNVIKVEEWLDLSSIYPGAGGTGDVIIYQPFVKRLLVTDYKHGAGIAVEVKNNKQLKCYALGTMLTMNVPCDEIVATIVQPRCFHKDGPIRSETYSPMELLDFAGEFYDACKATEDPNAPLVPGEYCRFCPAASGCRALNDQAMALAKQEFSPILTYDPEKLSETLHKLSTVEAWVKSVREFAYREAEDGRVPPGWKLVDKRANRQWLSGVDAETLTKHLGGMDIDYFELKFRSVAQVEKLLGKDKKKKELLKDFTKQESSGHTLVPESDSREPVRLDPASVFDVIK